jgi:hypothetical protein
MKVKNYKIVIARIKYNKIKIMKKYIKIWVTQYSNFFLK